MVTKQTQHTNRSVNNLIQIMGACQEIDSKSDFSYLLENEIMKIIPFDNFGGGIGNVINYKIKDFMAIGFSNQWLNNLITSNGSLNCPVAQAWSNKRIPIAINNIEEMLPVSQEWVSDTKNCGIRSFMVNGVVDIGSNETSYIAFANNFAQWTEDQTNLFALLTPHLHILFKKIFNNSNNAKTIQEILSSREREVLAWNMKGKTSIEIAELLNISRNTVKNHVQNIIHKLDVSNKTQAAVKAVYLGMLIE